MKPLIVFAMFVLLAGCEKTHPASNPAPPPTLSALRFLALGDSYTIGEQVDEKDRWPVQLAAALRSSGVDISDPKIIARTGWRTDQLASAIDSANLQNNYDLVGLLIGVNNQFQGRSEDEYRTQFADLLQRSIQLAGNRPGHVFVISIPDWGATPFARQVGASASEIGSAIDRFNAIAKEITLKANVAFIDITPISRENRDLIADDGLHPSGAMYAKWVEAALPAARKSLGH